MEILRTDAVFMEAFQQKKTITGFLEAVFGFLYRHTNFYHSKMDPNIRRNIIVELMARYEYSTTMTKPSVNSSMCDDVYVPPVAEEVEIEMEEMQEDMKEDVEIETEKTQEEAEKVPEEIQEDVEIETEKTQEEAENVTEEIQVDVEIETEKTQEEAEKVPEEIQEDVEIETEKTQEEAEKVTEEIQVDAEIETEKTQEEAEKVTEEIQEDIEIETEESHKENEKAAETLKELKIEDKVKQPNCVLTAKVEKAVETVEQKKITKVHGFSAADYKNGSCFQNYCWSQTLTDLELHIKLPSNLSSSKLLLINIKADEILVRDRSDPNNVIISGQLSNRVRNNDVLWTINEEKLSISMDKISHAWWERLFRTEEPIDLSKIDSERYMDELPEDTQAAIQKIRLQQIQENKPNIELEKTLSKEDKMERLRIAWDAEGSPFKGQPFDPSIIKFS